ncbi:hypothetical protein EDB81DRAFT_98677 [Dactylonectria macrodidyma]|uniref:Uncharacterized protein n=1 Tax=Dactylonectria macrodidyma TaxID=307937 RepID=A0A9P9IXB2_9HYPO|nr:hypothetical protein EDB81DRAFT_98677 [Dactylonectria macrodidyma]
MPQSTPSMRAQIRAAQSAPEFSFHASIRESNLAKLRQLIDSLNPADLRQHLDADDGLWGKPIHAAVICNDSAAVAMLLGASASPVSVRSDSDDAPTPLAIAARQGNQALLQQLWQHADPDLHASNYRGLQSYLISAALHGQAAIVSELLGWWDGWRKKAQDQALSSGIMMWHLYVVEVLVSKLSFNQQTLDRMLYLAADFKSPRRYERTVDYQGITVKMCSLLLCHSQSRDPAAPGELCRSWLTRPPHIRVSPASTQVLAWAKTKNQFMLARIAALDWLLRRVAVVASLESSSSTRLSFS